MLSESVLTPGQFLTFTHYLSEGQRIGQAFFNALDPESQAQLRGSIADPFYKDTTESVHAAVDYLTKG